MAKRIKVKGGELIIRDKEFFAVFRNANREAVETAAAVTEAHIKGLIVDSPRTGRRYRRGGVIYKATPPSSAPGVKDGVLLASIQTRTRETRRGQFEALVGTREVYARFLELGTRIMKPRPLFVRTLRELAKEYVAIFRKK